jgi:hypothetical protein
VVDSQRLRLPPATVERDHQLLVKPLPHGVRGGKHFQFTDQIPVVAKRETGFDPEGTGPQLLQPRDRCLRERLIADISQRRTAPKRQRLAKIRRRPARRAGLERATALPGKALETARVDTLPGGLQNVGTGAGQQHRATGRRFECLPEPGDVHLQRVLGTPRRALAPQPVN